MSKLKVGVMGCGNISDIYFTNGAEMFHNYDIVACADLDHTKAEEQAKKYNLIGMTPEELVANDDIDVILNLTTPQAHKSVAESALRAGKHVYNEKPICLTRQEGKDLLALGSEVNKRIGCAPDTFLGAGIQTARRVIDQGIIGEPIAATAFMTCHGHESWHPSPEFYYQVGGGPMFDMGPYYLTALISLVGPVKEVSSYAATTFKKREITSEPKKGKIMDVEVPTHIAGLMEFQNGAVGTIITSFDIWGANLPFIEVHGTKGSLSIPDPNTFGGKVKLKLAGEETFEEVECLHNYSDNSRGLGLADMCHGILTADEHKASGELAYHVLDIMHAFHDSAESKKHVAIESSCKQPEALEVDAVF